MTDPLETICNLTGCSMEDAERVYNETKDLVEAVDRLLEKRQSAADKYIESKRIKKEVTEEEKIIAPIRTMLKQMDDNISTSLNQRERAESAERLARLGEMVLQNNCSQECQIPSLESEAERQETACPSQFECSCDLQSSGQTLPCSDLQSLQSYQDQEKELLQTGERIPV